MAKSARIDGQPDVTVKDVKAVIPKSRVTVIRRGYANRRILIHGRNVPEAVSALSEAGITAHVYGSPEEIANRLIPGAVA